MASQLILPPQKFKYKDIIDQFPVTGNPKKKVFFQAELRLLSGSNATFGIVAYPSWKDGNKWEVGKQVSGVDTGGQAKIEPFTNPIAFANNEVVLSLSFQKKGKKLNKIKTPKTCSWNKFMKLVTKNWKNEKELQNATLVFETGVSENPHLEYTVTLDLGGTSLSVATKPSPPAPPES